MSKILKNILEDNGFEVKQIGPNAYYFSEGSESHKKELKEKYARYDKAKELIKNEIIRLEKEDISEDKVRISQEDFDIIREYMFYVYPPLEKTEQDAVVIRIVMKSKTIYFYSPKARL